MSQVVDDELQLLDVRAPLSRVVLILPLLFAIITSWFVVRWYIGDTIAEYSPPLEDGGVDIARASERLAPDDPLTHWSVATILKNSLEPAQLQESLKEFEEAVSLSPNDYRFWIDLGRARSQAGDLVGADKALRQAVALAPGYSYPRWYFGNVLLREGKTDEAFAELRKAADSESSLRPQIFNLATHIYGDDIEAIKNVLGGEAEARAQLVTYLISRNRVDDAMRVWASLSPAEKTSEKATTDALMKVLLSAKRFKSALAVFRENNPADAANAEPGKILNASFEGDIRESGKSPFGWQIRSAPPQLQLALDTSVFHSGQRSLRAVFKSTSQMAFNNISQLLVTDPSTQYHLEFWAKTDQLKSVGTPLVEIVDVFTGNVIGKSEALHVDSSDWKQVSIDFKTGASTEAVMLRTNRSTCGTEAAQCPIFGVVWYDDFSLQRTSGNNSTGTGKS